MRCYIPTRVTERLRSHVLAESLGLDWYLVVDNARQEKAAMNLGVDGYRIIIAKGAPGPPGGAAFKRNYVATQVAPIGEWLVWLDDNVQHLSGIRPKLSKVKLDFDDGRDWRNEFKRELTPNEVWNYIDETLEEAERLGTINCGFATEENYFFRKNKWQHFGYCRTQFTLYKNDGSEWAPISNLLIEDMYKTVDVVARYGCVVINRHMKPVKPFFEAGGIGSLEERLPHLRRNCEWIKATYPGLVTSSKGRDYHVTFKRRSFNTVNRWRKEHGYA